MGCVTVVDEDGGWARERARARVAPYLDVVAHRDPTLELNPVRSLPLDRFTIAGTPEEVAARVEELWAAGADRVELGTPQGRTTRSRSRADLQPRPAAAAGAERRANSASTRRSEQQAYFSIETFANDSFVVGLGTYPLMFALNASADFECATGIPGRFSMIVRLISW